MPSLTRPQWDFLSDRTTPNLAFSGGMGSGKSFAGAMKVLDLALSNPGHPGIVWGPTTRDAKEGVINTAVKILRGEHDSGFHIPLPFGYDRGTGYITLFPGSKGGGKETVIMVRSGEQDIVGSNCAWALADELDTVPRHKARLAWQQLTQRIRVGKVNQLCATTTPEGYKTLWELFVQEIDATPELARMRRLIVASLLSNPHVTDEYIARMIATHTPLQQRARIHGEFVNLYNDTVYSYFDRRIHHVDTTLTDYPNADIWAGLDFNVGRMACVVGIALPNKLIVVAEHVGTKENPILDTPAMIRLLKERYPGRTINICPDASGENRSAAGWATSITELTNAGFLCHHDASNPPIELRVGNVNKMLYAGHPEVDNAGPTLWVNTKTCPFVTNVLEQQAYDDKGKPAKDNKIDHAGDAIGYLVMQTFGERLGREARNQAWRH